MEKKNILIAKLGGSNGRICFGKIAKDGSLKPSKDITSGCTEAKTIIGMLEKSGKFNISVLTKVLDGDYLPDKYTFYNVLELANQDMQSFLNDHHFDQVMIINGSLNCFGGVEDAMIPDLCIYKLMHYFNGKIIYCQCDLAINFIADVYAYISGKIWSSKYKREEYDLSGKDIWLLTQAHDLDAHLEKVNKGKNYMFPRDHVVNFSFEKYPCIMPFAHVDKNENPEFDLGYGGTLRGGRRVKKLAKWYFNHRDLKVHLYGKTEDDKLLVAAKKAYGDDVVVPEFSGTCNFVDNGKVLNKSLATIVIGDDIFEKTQTVQQRAYQAMCANVITFIDNDLDKNHRIFGFNQKLASFMYVMNPSDVEKRIMLLKTVDGLRDKILKIQQKLISFDVNEWTNELAEKVIA